MHEVDWDNLPPTTMPPNLGIVVKGFTNQEAAVALAQSIGGIVHTVGSFIDLSTLDGVTVAVDYDDAIATVDRGMEGLPPLTRSDTAEMQGVAMSPAVLRDGQVRTHIVIDAERLVPLIWEGPEVTEADRALAVGIIAHECGHVQVTAEKERSVPDARLGARVEGFEHAVMFQIAEICWDEYAVCRLSGLFARDQNVHHAETLVDSARLARTRSDEEIRAYRLHGDLRRLVGEAGGALCQPIKAASYLLGGMDHLGTEWSELPVARSTIEETGFAAIIDEMHAELRRLWDTRGDWSPDLPTFDRLEAIMETVFASGGLLFSTDAAGECRIDVPFTPGTTPRP